MKKLFTTLLILSIFSPSSWAVAKHENYLLFYGKVVRENKVLKNLLIEVSWVPISGWSGPPVFPDPGYVPNNFFDGNLRIFFDTIAESSSNEGIAILVTVSDRSGFKAFFMIPINKKTGNLQIDKKISSVKDPDITIELKMKKWMIE